MAKLLKGKPVADKIKENLKIQIENLYNNKSIIPTLGLIQVGQQEDSSFYQQNILKCCKSLGINLHHVILSEKCSQSSFNDIIHYMNFDKEIHGILILTPLPKNLFLDTTFHLTKDIDGITGKSIFEILEKGTTNAPLPCTAEACLRLLLYYYDSSILDGANIVVIGRSLTVGKPLSLMLQAENATVTMCHSHTRNLDKICKNADIIFSAAGQKNLIGTSAVHKDQIIIDVSTNWDEEKNKFVGDVNFEEVEPIVKAISPVPGGVGSITTAILAEHVVKMARFLTT